MKLGQGIFQPIGRQDGDLVRVSGYLVKKSDLERLKNSLHVNMMHHLKYII
ncbi:glycyl radical enzyme domain-containing protein [Tissierella praeacuta]|uniref:glycyl radical enzyme domain-containing protein n=1 Tax=Tissierella praeacuta TaxID=43131 RepID=UPI003C7C631D